MELGIGIAITDHNEIKGAVAIDEYKDLLTIPGIEITSAEGSHLLVYFYNINELKIFFGIAIINAALDCGLSFITACVGLIGLYLILDGIADLFMWLGSLSKTDPTTSHQKNPA